MLTWESPKEMIFEMPVRSRVPRFSVSRAARAAPYPRCGRPPPLSNALYPRVAARRVAIADSNAPRLRVRPIGIEPSHL